MSDPAPAVRRHDLDALRAFAMLLGILLHAGLSFAPFPWLVQDTHQNEAYGLLFAAIHGFRMPVFFVMSGYFTAMMWRRRGLASTMRRRAQRIVLPLVLAAVTIVPLFNWLTDWAISLPPAATPTTSAETPDAAPATLVEAVRAGDPASVRRMLDDGADPDSRDARFSASTLSWAAMHGEAEAVGALLDAGADVAIRNGDGATALHGAAFFGHADTVRVLIDRGADVSAQTNSGDTPLGVAHADWPITEYFAGLLSVPLASEPEVAAGREAAAEALRRAGAKETGAAPAGLRAAYSNWIYSDRFSIAKFWTADPDDRLHLVKSPVFHHLWFLWFLCWLLVAFAVYAGVADRFGWRAGTRWAILPWTRYLWLLPVTLVPAYFMHHAAIGFGPDTSTGLLPEPHLLVYYGVFYFFGVAYYDGDDTEGAVGRRWRLTLTAALALAFPLGLATIAGPHPLDALTQALYAWMMIFGLMGMFRQKLDGENATIRYLSDSSYWLYLAHLPLVVVAQAMVRDWDAPSIVKFALVCIAVVALLLVTYDKLVRYTWLGTLLNGPRERVVACDSTS